MELESAIIEAHVGGLSVIEIGRVLRMKPATVHTILRKRQAIEALVDRPTNNHECNGRWLKALNKHGLSLERWCLGWGHSVEEAISAMNGEGDDIVRESLMRDFPVEFKQIFKTEPTWRLKIIRDAEKHYNFSVAWDCGRHQYRCEVQGVHTGSDTAPIGFGLTPAFALAAGEESARLYRQIRCLKLAVSEVQAWVAVSV
jgi:hypothetical protein